MISCVLLSVVNQVETNYETDLFMPIIERTQQLTGHTDEERDAHTADLNSYLK